MKKRFYEVRLRLEVEDDGWDSHCDRDFGVLRAISNLNDAAEACTGMTEITEGEFQDTNFILDESGGI